MNDAFIYEKPTKNQYAGAEWIEKMLGPHDGHMSRLGRAVADLLGDLMLGIYHLDEKKLCKVDWADDYYICVPIWNPQLHLYDRNRLTVLVVLAHAYMLRVEVNPRSNSYIELIFHQRKSRTGQFSQRLPYLSDHIASINKHYGLSGHQSSITGPRAHIEIKEVTRDPIFIIQVRQTQVSHRMADSSSAYNFDGDGSTISVDRDEQVAGRDFPMIVEGGSVSYAWNSVAVAYSREEADAYVRGREDYRVFAVPAVGSLVGLLNYAETQEWGNHE